MASNRVKLETPEYKARLFVFSERLRKERKKLDITQSALAERAGLSGHPVISRWEAVADPDRGGDFTSPGSVARELPDVNDMLKLCAVFGCEIDYLVGIQDLPTKNATDIADVTGLSDKAINQLKLLKNKISNPEINVLNIKKLKQDLQTINDLIEDGIVVYYISEYFNLDISSEDILPCIVERNGKEEKWIIHGDSLIEGKYSKIRKRLDDIRSKRKACDL